MGYSPSEQIRSSAFQAAFRTAFFIRGDKVAYSRLVSQDSDDKNIEFQLHSMTGRDMTERMRIGDVVYALIGGKPAKLTCTREVKPQQAEGATFRGIRVFASTDPNAVYGANQKMPARIRAFHATHLSFECDSSRRTAGGAGSGQRHEVVTYSSVEPRDRNCRSGVSSTPVVGVDPSAEGPDLFIGRHVGVHQPTAKQTGLVAGTMTRSKIG